MEKNTYDRLSDRGKLRRIHALAYNTVKVAFGLHGADVSLYCFATNPLYSVRTREGNRLILRMGYPGWRTLQDLQSEALWLSALNRDTDIGAPVPIRAVDGRYVVPATGQGVPYTWNATLMSWLDGRLLEYYLTPSNLRKFGTLFARLHVHGGEWKPPSGFSDRLFDSYLSRGEPELLFSRKVLNAMARDRRNTLLWARERVAEEYASLDRRDLRAIHCDLWHENVKVRHGKLYPFDFEDTVRGFRLHDLAMGLLDLLETVGNDRYADLLPFFRKGYEEVLPWPSGCLEVLQIGRMLWMSNWYARFHGSGLDNNLDGTVAAIEDFRKTGRLRPVS